MARTITIIHDQHWSVLDTQTESLTIGLCMDEALATVARMMCGGAMPHFHDISTNPCENERIRDAMCIKAKQQGRDEAIEEMKKHFMLLPHQLMEGPKK